MHFRSSQVYLYFPGIFHHSIPVLSQPVKNKLSLNNVFGVGFAFTTAVYVALGLVLGMYFSGSTTPFGQVRVCARALLAVCDFVSADGRLLVCSYASACLWLSVWACILLVLVVLLFLLYYSSCLLWQV